MYELSSWARTLISLLSWLSRGKRFLSCCCISLNVQKVPCCGLPIEPIASKVSCWIPRVYTSSKDRSHWTVLRGSRDGPNGPGPGRSSKSQTSRKSLARALATGIAHHCSHHRYEAPLTGKDIDAQWDNVSWEELGIEQPHPKAIFC